jgi:hypothetical protein
MEEGYDGDTGYGWGARLLKLMQFIANEGYLWYFISANKGYLFWE